MKWMGGRQSGNIEDRRGFSGGGLAAGGGIVGLVIYLLINLLGGDTSTVASVGEPRASTELSTSESNTYAQFASSILASTEDVWGRIFSEHGASYSQPTMVLFDGYTGSGCGTAESSTGPFYCPADEKVYLDLSFFNDLSARFGAAGDFANAYVIAHEVGHHVQKLLGTTDKVEQAMAAHPAMKNRLSVALELQADFYAGIWAHYNQEMFHNMEQGDLEEALNAANAIGDDRLQEMANGKVMPDNFTHGTSQQRVAAFKKGFESGKIEQGDTFSSAGL